MQNSIIFRAQSNSYLYLQREPLSSCAVYYKVVESKARVKLRSGKVVNTLKCTPTIHAPTINGLNGVRDGEDARLQYQAQVGQVNQSLARECVTPKHSFLLPDANFECNPSSADNHLAVRLMAFESLTRSLYNLYSECHMVHYMWKK